MRTYRITFYYKTGGTDETTTELPSPVYFDDYVKEQWHKDTLAQLSRLTIEEVVGYGLFMVRDYRP